ncbi:MAG: bis(5'-nucleosyl)-tetraphosphatase (symmetrical) YqeK [Tyzzerella sp.]|nr:bis(5'-nucleosyl)-tetraphosphatase (symmetrical) YqeK [Tyzzerella sp.]
MSQLKIDKMKKKVQNHLDKVRYEHTLGVMYTAGALAMRYQVDLEKALVAGLLHDCAKCLSTDKKLKLCEKYDLTVSASERKNPGLLHAKLGAYIAEKKYDIMDKEIIDAIAYHTTGRPGMTLLGKIVYIADYIEPNRNEAPNLDEVRRLAFVDIDKCLYVVLKDSLAYLKTRNEVIDPMTEETYLYYKEVLEK